MRIRLLSALAVVPLAFGLALGAAIICPKCGHETDSAGAACRHCQAPMAGPAAPKPAPAAPGTSEYLPVEIAKEDFDLGKKYLADNSADLAWLLFRNAVALERLARKDEEGKRAEALQKYVDQGMTTNRMERFVCPVCGGKDNPTTSFDDLRGGTRRAYKECSRCGKQKALEKPCTIAQWLRRVQLAATDYSQIQARRGRVEEGRAWLPREWKDKLSLEQRVTLRQALAAPCSDCGGTGVTDCTLCQGLGEVKCGKCEMGLVKEREKKLLKTTVVFMDKCAVCGGIGGGYCPKCEGKGRIPCARCAGSGKRDVCAACKGAGLTECPRCHGAAAGKDKPCPDCGGGGKTLCPTCDGDGRKR